MKIFDFIENRTSGIVKILLAIIFILTIIAPFLTNKSDAIPIGTPYKIIAWVTSGGEYQTGLSVNLAIMRNSDGKYLDFSSNTFKSSGWTTQNTIMSEDTTTNTTFPYYYYNYVLPSSETSPEIYYFFAKCDGATKMYDVQCASWHQVKFYTGR